MIAGSRSSSSSAAAAAAAATAAALFVHVTHNCIVGSGGCGEAARANETCDV
jgi:hypothetical protein